jgi:flagellar basal-body rod protein FlgG
MIRSWYTGASGMRAQQWRLDAIANNLANVDADAYKKDVVSFKSFPEMLMRRMNDDGVHTNPMGSVDSAPIIGKLGTGVELNELFTNFEQGGLKQTDSDFDLALDGKGFFAVSTPWGERYTRNGSFQLGKEGFLETKEGYPVQGENGSVRIGDNEFQVDKLGRVWIHTFNEQGESENTLVDTLKIVGFDIDRYLQKQGSSLYRSTDVSGDAQVLGIGDRPRVIQGFTEASNVDPVVEMVQMIEVNRAYEANQKVIQSGDTMLGTLINQVARVSG